MTLRGVFPSAEERARVIKEYGADKGLAQTLARLGEYVEDSILIVAAAELAALVSQTKRFVHPNANQECVMQVQPYLFFDGRSEEAIDFYKKAIGAKVEMLMRWKDSPDQRVARRRTRTR